MGPRDMLATHDYRGYHLTEKYSKEFIGCFKTCCAAKYSWKSFCYNVDSEMRFELQNWDKTNSEYKESSGLSIYREYIFDNLNTTRILGDKIYVTS